MAVNYNVLQPFERDAGGDRTPFVDFNVVYLQLAKHQKYKIGTSPSSNVTCSFRFQTKHCFLVTTRKQYFVRYQMRNKTSPDKCKNGYAWERAVSKNILALNCKNIAKHQNFFLFIASDT